VPEPPVALVTGANKAIGLQIAKDLAAEASSCWSGLVASRTERRAAKSIDGVGPCDPARRH